MGKLDKGAVEWLLKVPQQWSKHQFDSEVTCDHNTSNFVESFNSIINDLREKPVMSLMEGIRQYCVDKFAQRIDLAETLQPYDPTPYAKKLIESNCSDSRHCKVLKAGGGEFEVLEGNSSFPVNIRDATCQCGEWQVSGIPCKHACKAIYDNNEEPLHYVNCFHTGMCYKLTYSHQMHPMPDKEQWPSFTFPKICPPLQERRIGRPTRQRKRRHDEPKRKKGKRSTIVTCSICKCIGHNSRSCQGGLTAKQRKAVNGAGPSTQPPQP